MNAIQLIENSVKRAARRRRWEHAWRGLGGGLLAGGLVWLLALGIYKLFPIPPIALTVAVIAGAVLALGGAVAGAARKISLLETARWVDDKMKLQERLSTALEVSANSAPAEWKQLVVNDAAVHAREVDPRRLSPFRLPVVSRWALLVVLLGVGLGFVPEYRSKDYLKKKNDAANIKDTGKQLAEFTRRHLEQRPPALPPTQRAIESVAELGDKLTKASLTRGDALKDLTSLSDKLSQQVKELGKNPALKPLERAAREPGGAKGQTQEGLQKQMDALQKSLGNNSPDALDNMKKDLLNAQQAMKNLPDKDSAAGKAAREQLSQAMSELSKRAGEMGQSLAGLDDAIKALENNQTDLAISDLQNALTDLEKIKDMAKAMQNLQQQMSKLGKDLAEQLKNGQAQAAQQTLQKMIDQLKTANLSKEQLDKITEEVAKAIDPGSQYGKVGEHLQQAAQQCQGGQKSAAAQSLADAQKELDKLMQQMADAQAMKDALAAMDRAQMAIAMGKSWSQCQGGQCKSCNGAGCGQCNGTGQNAGRGGKPGRGVGTWAEENGWTYFNEKDAQGWDNSGIERPDMDAKGHTERDADLNPNLVPDKVRGKMSEGGPMPSIPLKGVSIKGQSKVQYEEAATSAQSEAQSALNQDQVPRAYQGAVRDYFDDLKK